MERIKKPYILEIEEAKAEMTAAVNKILGKHELPCYLFEGIIEEIHNRVTIAAKKELELARSQYESQCAADQHEPHIKANNKNGG